MAFPATALAVGMNGIGLSFGFSWMTQEYEYVEEIDFQGPVDGSFPGPVIGVFADIGFTDKFSAVAEIFYVQKGYKSEFIRTDTSGEITAEGSANYYAHYMTAPISLRYDFQSYGNTPFVYAGVATEIVLSRGDTGMFTFLHDVNVSGHVGAGLSLGRIGINVRYTKDLTNAGGPTGSLVSVKNEGVIGMFTVSMWQ